MNRKHRIAPRPTLNSIWAARRFRPGLETLEERAVPAIYSVLGVLDDNPGTVIDTGLNGAGVQTYNASSIRAAVNAINANPDAVNPDSILLPDGAYQLSILGSGDGAGDLDIRESLSIIGGGSTTTIIDAFLLNSSGSNGRVFDIHGGGITVSITGVTVSNAVEEAESQGGAIRNESALTLTDVRVLNSTLEGLSGETAQGGGIWSSGDLTLINSYVVGNTAIGNDDGLFTSSGAAEGGGIWFGGTTLTISNSVITDNAALGGDNDGDGEHAFGGGVFFAGSTLDITGSDISDNQAIAGDSESGEDDGGDAEGGGIWIGAGATVTIGLFSTISNNTALGGDGDDAEQNETSGAGGDARGGGIFAGDVVVLEVSQTEIANNEALAGNGGNGANGSSGGTAGNGGSGGGGGRASGGGIFIGFDAALDLVETAILTNVALGGAGGFGGNGGTDTNGGLGGAGGSGGDGGEVSGGGISVAGGSAAIFIELSELNGNLANGGAGGAAGNGGNAGNSGIEGGDGGNGGAGGFGGASVGGGLAVFGSVIIDVSATDLEENTAQSGSGGAGGNGGNVFDGAGAGDVGGAAGAGGGGGDASGGAFYSEAHDDLFMVAVDVIDNAALAGHGGGGGNGGNVGNDGTGGAGGAGGDGGFVKGGGIFSDCFGGGNLDIADSEIAGNEAVAGHGGNGGNGGGDADGVDGDIIDGGAGGAGGLAGDAEGGGLFTADGTSISAEVAFNVASAGNGGTGGSGGQAGDASGAAGLAGNGADGGAALGGGIHNDGGMVIFDSTIYFNEVYAGNGGTGGTGGSRGLGAGAAADGGAGGSGGLAAGGGVFNDFLADLDVDLSTIADNIVSAGNGGVGGTGGSAGNGAGGAGGNGGDAGADIAGILVSAGGGGIANLFGAVDLYQTTVDNNTVSGGNGGTGGTGGNGTGDVGGNGGNGGEVGLTVGGGVGSLGNLTITSSTISLNVLTAGNGGTGGTGGAVDGDGGFAADGGIAVGGGVLNDEGDLFISNSTISTNTATGGNGGGGGTGNGAGTTQANGNGGDAAGGGVANFGGTSPATIGNSTIAFNTATGGAGNVDGDALGGGFFNLLGTDETAIYSTIISNNTVGGGGTNFGPDAFSNAGGIDSQGFNLIGNDADVAAEFDQITDILNGNANLGVLQNNGGPTETHLPGPGDAIDNGDNPDGLTEDQRGFTPRDAGGQTDIGAVEVGAAGPITIGVGSGKGFINQIQAYEGDGLLRWTVNQAFGVNYNKGVWVSVGDVNGDGVADVIASRFKGKTTVMIFDGLDGSLLSTITNVYGNNYKGGATTAVGDVNDDGFVDIVTAARTDTKKIKVYLGDGTGNYNAQPNFKFLPTKPNGNQITLGNTSDQGFSIAVGNVDAGNAGDEIVAVRRKGNNRVYIMDEQGASLGGFKDNDIRGSRVLAIGNTDGDVDTVKEIIISNYKSDNGVFDVRSFEADGTFVNGFDPVYPPPFKGGVNVASGMDINGDGDDEILTGPAQNKNGEPIVKVFDGVTLTEVDSFFALDGTTLGGLYVGVGRGQTT